MRSLRRSTGDPNIAKIKNNFYVLDTETTSLEPMPKNFVFGCMYGHCLRKTFYSVDDFIKELELPKYKDKFIFAHNAEFDLLTIFGNIFLKIDTAAIFNGKFISAKYKELTFADSMNIYPTSVARLGDLFDLPKLDNDKAKEGKLRKANITAEDVEYCMRDCEIVYKALLVIFEMTGVIKATLPSLAMYDFRHNYLETDLQFSELVDDFYESYYGGRTEAFFIGKCQAKCYDVNSLYPAAMAQVVLPDVKHMHKTEMADVSFLQFCLDHYEGMATVTVEHKKTYFGYLPCRKELNGSKKLVFPVGEFETTVNFNELRFAISAGVVKVKSVKKIIGGNPVPSIFTKYIQDNFAKRKTAKDKLESTIYKLKMNSLYGRFAMRLKMTTTYYEQVPFNLITELKEAEKYCDIKLFNALRADCFLITENERFKNSFFSIPALSSYITSEARVILLQNLIANEKNGVVYCDTDSIFVTDNFVGNVSDSLGDFKKEDKTITSISGLKNYTYADSEGKENIVIKGISRGSRTQGTNAQGETTYASERYIKTKAALRRGLEAGSAYTMVKTVRQCYDKREVLAGGDTLPLVCVNNEFINATTFLRSATAAALKQRHLNKQKKRFRYEPQNIKEAVMMFFIGGGKVYTKDLQDHVTGSSAAELKSYFGLYAKDGYHMDVFCESVPDEFYTDRIVDVFQDVLLSYNTVTKMREALQANADALALSYAKKISEYEFDYDVPF